MCQKKQVILGSFFLLMIIAMPIILITVNANGAVKEIDKLNVSGTSYMNGAGQKIDMIVFPSRNQSLTVNTTRTLILSEFFMVSLNDTIVITNNDSLPFNSILIYYEKDLFSRLENIRVMGRYVDEKEKVKAIWRIFSVSKYYVGIVITLDRYVFKGNTYAFSLFADLRGMISFKQVEDELRFYLNITQKILIPLPVKESKTICIPPQNSEVLEEFIEPQDKMGRKGDEIYWRIEDIAPFNESTEPLSLTKISFVYKLNEPDKQPKLPLEILYVVREVTITLAGKVKIVDKIGVLAISPISQQSQADKKWSANSIALGLMPGVDADNIKAYDKFGRLTLKEEQTLEEGIFENFTFIRVTFRNPLLGGEVYEFSLSYTLSGGDSVAYDNGKYVVRMPLVPIINATIGFVLLKVVSPYDVEIIDNGLRELALYTKYESVKGALFLVDYKCIKWAFSDMLPSFNKVIELRFSVNTMVFVDALIIVFQFVFALTVACIIGARKLGEKRLRVKIEETPELRRRRENLIRFIANYEEYLSIEEEIINELRVRTVLKRPSSKALQSITAKIGELRKKRSVIHELSERIRVDPDIEPLVDKLINVDAKMDLVRRKFLDDLDRHLRGVIKRSEFVSEAEISLNELNSYMQQKRRILNSLRELLIVKYARK